MSNFKAVCPKCGKVVKDLRKHLQRGRCKIKGRHKSKPLPLSTNPEERLHRVSTIGSF